VGHDASAISSYAPIVRIGWRLATGLAIGLELLAMLEVLASLGITRDTGDSLHSPEDPIIVGLKATVLVWLVVPILVAALALVLDRLRSALLAFAALTPLVYGGLSGNWVGLVLPIGAAFLLAGVILGLVALEGRKRGPGVRQLWIGAGCWLAYTAVAVAVIVYFALQFRMPPIPYI